MKIRIVLALTMMALSGCGGNNDSGNPLMGQLENGREYGTVLEVSQGKSLRASGVGNYYAAGVSNAAVNSATQAASGSIFSPIASMFGSAAQTPQSSPVLDTINTIHYVIRKDNGHTVYIDQEPEAEETILYPGQRAMIQMNGQYWRVYPSDVEYKLR